MHMWIETKKLNKVVRRTWPTAGWVIFSLTFFFLSLHINLQSILSLSNLLLPAAVLSTQHFEHTAAALYCTVHTADCFVFNNNNPGTCNKVQYRTVLCCWLAAGRCLLCCFLHLSSCGALLVYSSRILYRYSMNRSRLSPLPLLATFSMTKWHFGEIITTAIYIVRRTAAL